MYDWPWATIWSAVQGVGTVGAVVVALFLPRWQRQGDDLAKLKAARAIANCSARWVTDSYLSMKRGEDISARVLVFDYVRPSLYNINLSDIRPYYLVDHFIHLQGAHDAAKGFCEGIAVDRFDQVATEVSEAMRAIDSAIAAQETPVPWLRRMIP